MIVRRPSSRCSGTTRIPGTVETDGSDTPGMARGPEPEPVSQVAFDAERVRACQGAGGVPGHAGVGVR